MREKQWMKLLRHTGIDDHHQRLRESAPVVDSSAPRFKLQTCLRKESERARHGKKLKQDNKIILQRVANRYLTSEVDDKPPPQLAKGSHIKKQQVEKMKQRKRDVENLQMMKRIIKVKHAYSAKRWKEQDEIRQLKLRDMSSFPEEQIRETWGVSSYSRPASANALSRREAAWNSNTEVKLTDSNELLSTKLDLPNVEREKKPVRPSTADILRKKVRAATYNAKRSGDGGWVGYGRRPVERCKPGYSADPKDRDFDTEYKELFASAREDWLATQASGRANTPHIQL